MDTKTYLDRINYNGDLTPNLKTLRALQEYHLLAVPFENLDIHYGIPITLDVERFYDKIALQCRGGFCYELNGLFSHLLKAIGFSVQIVSARVFNNKQQKYGAEFDHLALLVEIDEKDWLVDVGFGEFAMQPLALEIGVIQEDRRGKFIVEKNDKDYLISKVTDKGKTDGYRFTSKVRQLEEFSGMCTYHQTDPDSHFMQNKLISRPTETGRITLTGNTLKITEGDDVVTQRAFPESQFEAYLKEWFDIDVADIVARKQ